MHKLSRLLQGLKINRIIGDQDVMVNKITFNSKDVTKGDTFIALKGATLDGHNYIESAINSGCMAVVCSAAPDVLHEDVTYVIVDDTSYALGIIASNFYDNPSTKLKLIGVTGTNGKTTTVYSLYQLFSKMGYKVGLMSTINNIVDTSVYKSDLTTPDSITINKLLSEMVSRGCSYCFMEASSHGTSQNRISGLHFVGGIFLNITHDHLDYHGSFNDYIKAKKKFFDQLPTSAFALTNIDDNKAGIMVQNTLAKQYTFAVHTIADFNAKCITNSISGLEIKIHNAHIYLPFLGEFNVYNILAAYAVSQIMNLDKDEVLTKLSTIQLPEGRLQVVSFDDIFHGIVDYAHTPDALKKLLQNLGSVKSSRGKLITVIGCGGNRDKYKRPIMGKIANEMSDIVIFTSDNPRNEEPENIIEDMSKELSENNSNKVLHIVDRYQAIKAAIDLATTGDIVVIAGKGHEDYQEIQGIKFPFSDFQVLKTLGFAKINKN